MEPLDFTKGKVGRDGVDPVTGDLPPELAAVKRRLFDSLDDLHTVAARAHAHADRLEHQRRERVRTEAELRERERRDAELRETESRARAEREARSAYADARHRGWLTRD
ncbi:hypothetical protein GCM10009624_20040 [Gordonia sinesedis]